MLRIRRGLRHSLPLAVGALGLAPAAPSSGITFGAAGDSLTDEYQFDKGLPALGFVEQLVLHRGLDFGSQQLDPAVRGEPRNEGYAHNWARFGASANEPTYSDVNLFRELPRLENMPLFEEQIEGLAMEIAAGDVDAVYLGIGANDFFIHLFLDGDFQGAGFQAFSQALVDKIFLAVDSFRAAGAMSVFVGAVPDELVPNPGARPPISPFIDPADYAAAVAETNQALADGAAARTDVHFVDLFEIVDARTDALGNITVDGNTFSVDDAARLGQLILNPDPDEKHGPCEVSGLLCASEAYAFNYYAHDEVHPNTIIQSLMANALVAALNDELGLGIAPLSDVEILEIALCPVPEPGPWTLFLAATVVLAWRARGRRARAS